MITRDQAWALAMNMNRCGVGARVFNEPMGGGTNVVQLEISDDGYRRLMLVMERGLDRRPWWQRLLRKR